MKKQSNRVIRVFKRSMLGVLICIDRFCSYDFDAIVSTAGALRISRKDDKTVHKAYAAGEWHTVDNFTADYSDK